MVPVSDGVEAVAAECGAGEGEVSVDSFQIIGYNAEDVNDIFRKHGKRLRKLVCREEEAGQIHD